jgi:pyruvate,water dikinase
MGLSNTKIMIPFVRTLNEARSVISLLSDFGLQRGVNALEIYMMCEVPSNAILAEDFLKYFDGFSIGSNDLTQLTLGLDRDSSLVANSFDERDPAVKSLLHHVIKTCRQADKYIGICGQAPSDHLDFAKWLVDEGINSLSLSPDTIVNTWLHLSQDRH